MTEGRFILIVEDCDEAVAALQIALETFYQCPVLHSPDGLHALETLAAEQIAPLAVITDLNLPGVSGYSIIEHIRSDRKLRQTPVVVISADTDPGASKRVRALGADAFFPKPYSPAGVCQSLEKILDAKRKLVPFDNVSSGADGADRL
jgi:two-component system chemotaxis response regulator CheY